MPAKQAEELVDNALQKVLQVTLNPSHATDSIVYLEETAKVCPPQTDIWKARALLGYRALSIHIAWPAAATFLLLLIQLSQP